MTKLLLTGPVTLIIMASSAWATGQDELPPTDPALNINARYVVDRVVVKRDVWSNRFVSTPLRKDIDQVVGQNLDQSML